MPAPRLLFGHPRLLPPSRLGDDRSVGGVKLLEQTRQEQVRRAATAAERRQHLAEPAEASAQRADAAYPAAASAALPSRRLIWTGGRPESFTRRRGVEGGASVVGGVCGSADLLTPNSRAKDEVWLRRHLSRERERPVAHKRSDSVDERRAEHSAAPPRPPAPPARPLHRRLHAAAPPCPAGSPLRSAARAAATPGRRTALTHTPPPCAGSSRASRGVVPPRSRRHHRQRTSLRDGRRRRHSAAARAPARVRSPSRVSIVPQPPRGESVHRSSTASGRTAAGPPRVPAPPPVAMPATRRAASPSAAAAPAVCMPVGRPAHSCAYNAPRRPRRHASAAACSSPNARCSVPSSSSAAADSAGPTTRALVSLGSAARAPATPPP